MTRRLVLCVRFTEWQADAARRVAFVTALEDEQVRHGGHLVGWGADRVTLSFPEQAQMHVFALAGALQEEADDRALGIAVRELTSAAERPERAAGLGLQLAEALATAARAGEILLDPELSEAPGLLQVGRVKLRVGDVVLVASACVAGSPLEADRPALTPGLAAVSLRPVSSRAPPFRHARSVGPQRGAPGPAEASVRKATPPPKPTSVQPEPAREPPPKPAVSVPPTSSLRPERPSVVEALRSGKPHVMLELAEALRAEGGQETLVKRLTAMAHVAQGEVGDGLRALRGALQAARSRDAKGQGRAALALGVGLAMAGKKQEALLQGLDALAHARTARDAKGELACTSFIAQLARAAAEPDVASAWLAVTPKSA